MLTIVGDTHEYYTTTFMLTKRKDIFIYYYKPWCEHCKRFDPIWEQTALQASKQSETIVFAKMNMQDNDIVGRAFTEYPTLLFWSREDPKHPIEFEPKPS